MPFVTFADLRHAWRGIVRAPSTSVCAVACLGLGLGATTAVSSAIDRAMLQPPPFKDPGTLVQVYRTAPQGNNWPMSAPNYLDFARQATELSAMAAITWKTSLLSLPDESTQVNALRVTGSLFPMLGVPAERGRLLLPADDEPSAPPVVVLGDAFWRQQFAADPAIVGRSIRLDGIQVTVVGIAPRELRIPRGGSVLSAPLWLPMRFSPGELSQRGNNYLMIVGRVGPHATISSASVQLKQAFDAMAAQYPNMNGEGVRLQAMQAEAVQAVRSPLLLIFGAVWLVLLIAATDVASLLLARGVQRRREMAVRLALGGGRLAVMRPVLLESLLLTAFGVTLGIAMAWLGVRTIGALAARRLPQLAGLGIDARVVGLTLLLAGVVAVVCGGLPAWRSAATDPQDALRGGRGGGVGRGQHRVLGALVIIEVALSFVLLVGAGLVLKGFVRLAGSDPGFDLAPILTLRATVSPESYPDNASVRRFLDPALAAIRAVPGVAAAGSSQLLPYENWGWNFNVRYDGQSTSNTTQLPLVEVRNVDPGFFLVTRQRLISGRLLRPSDDDRPGVQQVAVVNAALVRRDFKGRDPIGQRMHSGSDTASVTIVGVVGDIRNVGPFRPPAPEMYQTFAQGGSPTSYPILVRVAHGDPLTVSNAVTAAIRGVDPQAAVTDVRPMSEVMAASVGEPRFYLTLLGTFAAIAVVLALAGLYGVMSYVVAQGTREIGIRTALGSGTAAILGLVTAEGMRLVGAGLVLGVGAGVAVTRLLTGLLYGVSPLDPGTWVATAALLVLAALVAALVPALRATRVDPATAMRVE